MSVWEERWHPLREEWVIVAAHRQDRPWVGQPVGRPREALPPYAPDCTFCPGNSRVSGIVNERYARTFVFDNDLPCVGPDAPEPAAPLSPVFRNRSTRGVTRVVCYSPRHDTTLAELPAADVENLVEVWQRQYRDLGERPEIDHVLIFENKGEVVGVSNPHPHCQIVAPKATRPSVADLGPSEVADFAAALSHVLVRFDNLWRMPFPYVMPLHQAPTDGGDYRSFHFHVEFHPPLRKPDLLEYLAGPEIGGSNFLSDTSPEEKAAELRALPNAHHSKAERTLA